MDSVVEATKMIMNLKLEMKLGLLIKIFPQLRRMMEKSSIKMRENQIVGVYKITTKAKDFDEVMPIVQVQGGKFEIKDVLLDGGSSVTTRNFVFCNQSLCNWHVTSCHLQLSWSCLQL
jgi:hypothetical protein